MNRMNASPHAYIERRERIEYIEYKLGFGEPVFTYPSNSNPNNDEELTSTGVIIIRDRKTRLFVTAFIATIGKVTAAYKSNGYKRVPDEIYKRVIKNRYLYENQPRY